MYHIAIMKPAWNLLPKILDGTKTVESRWYKSKIAPWNQIKSGDIIFFKDSGKPVTVKATVTKVEQYEITNNKQAIEIMSRYAIADLGNKNIPDSIKNYINNKKYAIFIHFDNVTKITPFNINKKGYGMQCAWICINSIDKIKI